MNWLRALVTPPVTGSHAAAMRSAVPGPRIIGESQCVLFSIVQTVHRLCGCFHQNQWLNVLICRTKLTIMSWRLVLADKEGSLKAGLTAFPRPEDVESQDNQFCESLSVVLAAGQCCLLHRHTLPIILESAMEKTTNSGRRSKAATSFSQETFPAQRSTKSKSASKKPGPKPQTATKTKTAAEGASAGKVVQKTPNPNKKKSSGLANLTCSVTDLTFSQLEEQSVFFISYTRPALVLGTWTRGRRLSIRSLAEATSLARRSSGQYWNPRSGSRVGFYKAFSSAR